MRRRDMREVLTFTIDPADAKDFDDALSFAEQEDGTLQVGVHIADVTHYVKPGSQVDNEAYERGTSTYLVDRVLPMLPEELCNDLCSLRPHEDKLCMSVIFSMKPDATVLKHKLCRTVIRSDARLNYDDAQSIIEHSAVRRQYSEFRCSPCYPAAQRDSAPFAGSEIGQRRPGCRAGRDAIYSR